MAALIEACHARKVPAEIVLVVSPKADSPAAIRAEELGVAVSVLSAKSETYSDDLAQVLAQSEVEWICLAGYMTKLPGNVLASYPARVLNIHPALLPKFGGKGMYGHHVHEAVIHAGETESGCTVHIVTEEYDEGPIVLQLRCPVLPEDSPETLAERVLKLEHEAYPRALNGVIESNAGPA